MREALMYGRNWGAAERASCHVVFSSHASSHVVPWGRHRRDHGQSFGGLCEAQGGAGKEATKDSAS